MGPRFYLTDLFHPSSIDSIEGRTFFSLSRYPSIQISGIRASGYFDNYLDYRGAIALPGAPYQR
jgi:hypothetical protein